MSSLLRNPTESFGGPSIVTLLVSCGESGVASERRFDKGLTVAMVKNKLEPVTGVPASSMRLSLLSATDAPICQIDNDERMLGYYPVQDYMRIHVVDSNPHAVKGAFTDVSQVQKYEISEDDYNKRTDSVRAFKQKMKLGRFAEAAEDATSVTLAANDFRIDAEKIKVGDRCRSAFEEGSVFEKRGVVKFVGETKFKPGYWVGVEYDEPLGKHDGSVDGVKYFEAKPKYGVFLRPNKVEIGDFPELGLDDMDEI